MLLKAASTLSRFGFCRKKICFSVWQEYHFRKMFTNLFNSSCHLQSSPHLLSLSHTHTLSYSLALSFTLFLPLPLSLLLSCTVSENRKRISIVPHTLRLGGEVGIWKDRQIKDLDKLNLVKLSIGGLVLDSSQ